MIKIIGYCGGTSLYDTGTLLDTILFFDCLTYFVADRNPSQDWSILTDRLYRRYMKLEELDLAADKMLEAEHIFSKISCSEIDWTLSSAQEKTMTWLDPRSPDLAKMFHKYFKNFHEAKESALLSFDTFKIYLPVKIVPTDLGGWATEKERPLEEYESLNGDPFWRH